MIHGQEGIWRVEGAVKVDTAHTLLHEAEAIWAADSLTVDLSGIGEADSAVVAVLLAWKRRAHRLGKKIEYLNPTDSVRSLVVLYDVAELLFAADSRQTMATLSADQ